MIPQWQSQSGLQYVASLTPAAWYRYGVGITSAGGLVSAWADQSGNGRDIVQGTGTNQPTLDTDNSILFDGVDNFMQVAFTITQPATMYILYKPVTHQAGLNEIFTDGIDASHRMTIGQNTATNITLYAGSATVCTVAGSALGSYGVAAGVFNGASSVLQFNATNSSLGDPGSNAPNGLTIGGYSAGTGFCANCAMKEAILFPAAHSATVRNNIIKYLNLVGGL